jgi:hypothetical protein
MGGQHHAPAALPLGKTPYPLYRRLGGPRPVWTCAKKPAPTGIRSPDRQARSQSLYRLCYPVQLLTQGSFKMEPSGFYETSADKYHRRCVTSQRSEALFDIEERPVIRCSFGKSDCAYIWISATIEIRCVRKVAVHLGYGSDMYRRSCTSLPTPFISAQRLSERRSARSGCG